MLACYLQYGHTIRTRVLVYYSSNSSVHVYIRECTRVLYSRRYGHIAIACYVIAYIPVHSINIALLQYRYGTGIPIYSSTLEYVLIHVHVHAIPTLVHMP